MKYFECLQRSIKVRRPRSLAYSSVLPHPEIFSAYSIVMEKRNLHDLEVQNLLHENEELRKEISSHVHFTSFKSKTSIYRNLVLSIAILFPWCIIVFLSPWTRTTCPRALETIDGCPAKLFYSEYMAHRSPCLACLNTSLIPIRSS